MDLSFVLDQLMKMGRIQERTATALESLEKRVANIERDGTDDKRDDKDNGKERTRNIVLILSTVVGGVLSALVGAWIGVHIK